MAEKPVPLDTKKIKPKAAEPLDEKIAQAVKQQGLEAGVVEALKSVYDPEIPINIYELGLIYQLDVNLDGRVHVQMTLTSPNCPVAGSLPGEVEAKIKQVPGVTSAKVELVWDPPFTPEMMSDAARLQLGLF